jgi:hypothetical protein
MTDKGNKPIPTRPPIPGWVKGFVIVGVLLTALAAVMALTGHGPGRHFGMQTESAQ